MTDQHLRSRFVRVSDGQSGILDKGSFGTVRLAIDSESKNAVAVKTLEFPSNDAAREVALYNLLEKDPHPNIVKMLCHFPSPRGVLKQYINFVFELASTDLWQHWRHPQRQSGLQDIRLSASYLRDAAKALQHFHGTLRVLHADPSPKNFLLFPGDVVKLADFGRSQCADSFLHRRPLATIVVRPPEAFSASRN